jgi:outer membrane protein insertion porin family
MQKKQIHTTFLLAAFIACMGSCSVQKYIPENETLYKSTDIKLSSKSKFTNEYNVKEEVRAVIRPKPNKTFFGLRFGLLMYFKAQKEKPNFIVKYFNKKLGEKPVYLSNITLNRAEQLILNRLENRGYYYSKIRLTKNELLGKINCDLSLSLPYILDSYRVVDSSLLIYKEISAALSSSDLKKGSQYNLDKFKEERERIDLDLKSKGYYYFNPDFLLFEIDTNQTEGKGFDLFVRLKKDIPLKAIIPYRLNQIYVFPKYSINNDDKENDTVKVNNIHFVQDSVFFLPKRLEPFILFQQNQRYNPSISRRTSNRLSSIGSYKFVNVQFEATALESTDSTGKLNAFIYLSPLKKRALRFELQGVTKSNSFAGPSFSMTHTNRNLFKGGEVINISTEFGYEKQFFYKNSEGLSSTQLGLKVDLLFPRLLFIVPLKSKFIYTIPKTKMSVGVDFLNRSNLYQLTSFNASFGYQWKASKYVYHEINPIAANYVRLGNASDEFNEILNDNPFLRSSFEQELIAGLTYNFTYTQLNNSKKKNPIFLSANLDIAGNSVSLLGSETNAIGKRTVLGIEYAQYVKLDADFRYYRKVGKKQTLIGRVFAGYGLAYGNSSTLPFSKQYFSGGPYSVRAFRIRALGPGTYSSNDNSSFFDQSGDIRLEANLEYRFPLISILKGALFVDAGNVWLREENESLPGGKFSSNFMNELGIGTGLGIRFDIQSFVIRFDLAAPLQKPFETENGPIQFYIEDAILNFALGYPF